MNNYVVVVGTSAGGLSALKNFLKNLPQDFKIPVLIVMHVSRYSESALPNILKKYTHLKIEVVKEDQALESGTIYFAPPNFHMTINKKNIFLEQGPKINHCRPAIDPLFYSAAYNFGPCAIGILLSGLLDDGSAGLLAIKRYQGKTIVQNLEDAEYPDMPRNALKNMSVDYCVNAEDMAKTLVQIIQSESDSKDKKCKHILLEEEMGMNKTTHDISEEEMNKAGKPSVFACPVCHGVLWEIKDKELIRYRCRIGHAFGLETLFDSIANSTENVLWAALRALEEKENFIKQALESSFYDLKDKTYLKKEIDNTTQQIHTFRHALLKN